MNRICPRCGHHSLEENPRFCSACGDRIDGCSISVNPENETRREDVKDPQVALFCSSLIPGLGQVYNGETLKGFFLLLGSLVGAFLLLIPGLVVWIYSMYDAYVTAGKMNDGTLGFRPVHTIHMVLFIAAALVIAIAVIVIVAMIVISGMLSLLGTPGNSDPLRMLQYYGFF